MPKHQSRVPTWLWIPLLLMVVAGVGLEWMWSRWRSERDAGQDGSVPRPTSSLRWARKGTDLVSRSALAYARSDWDRAADLARQRLKTAPEDVEALRYLARSTARLGRDASANAMFARLGSTALQAEDLFLLGLGLDRAGQKDAAEGVWVKALRLEPDHAETIEQLIIRYTAQNRLAESAQLAERLARQPGWEWRGELDLGALRAELSDPAGAATVLRQALQRPGAARLDRSMATRYRNLLARTLLQTGRPGEARVVLRRVLDDGPDPQASWLLSRAALQEGAIPEATAALQDSGTYRAEHPLESEPSLFLGEARCADCHREIFRAVQASRHASTLVRDQQLARLPYPDQTVPDPDDSAVYHTIRREGNQVHFETRVKDQVQRALVAYAFGSPDHYVSLVGRDDHGIFHVLRLSRYQNGRDSGWVRTTGHAADAGEGHDFLGKPLDIADGVFKCLFCHATNPRAILDDAGPESRDRAIGCERCHGPARSTRRRSRPGFATRRLSVRARPRPRGAFGFAASAIAITSRRRCPTPIHSGSGSRARPCRGAAATPSSEGALDCMTCHNPHHDTDRSEQHYTERCLSCHSTERDKTKETPPGSATRIHQAVRGVICPVNPVKGCVGCHMPPFESKPLHATFTDHYIRVHPEGTRTGLE